MAILPDIDRERIWRGFMRFLSNEREALAVNKVNLRAAINATDAWIDSNAASFNAALPLPARTQLTVAQKALMLAAVVLMRFRPDFLRRIVGEVD
ncbi:MAG TPA: hypothetical protein VI729_10340 [Anaerolineales bacterium]|nr:hypothetical protein [Anaerolineales bacterium]